MAMVMETRKPGAVELVLAIAEDILTDIQVKEAEWFLSLGGV